MIRLSICIATYNRGPFIGATLDSILSQATDEVEIIVVDGASSDNTEAVVKAYVQKSQWVRYIRLAEKGGVDQDFCRAVEAAEGEYCWLFPDDDIIKSGGIRAVLDQISRHYDLILVNADVRNFDLSTLIENRRLPILENKVYAPRSFSEFFQENVLFMTFIGSVVIKRKIWDEREKEIYYGTEFVHLGVIFQRPLESDVLVIAEPYITIRLGNAQWSSRAFEIWMFKFPALIWSFSHVADKAKFKISPKEPWRQATRLMFSRAEGNYSLREYSHFIRPRISSIYKRMILRSVALLPGGLLNLLALAYSRVVFPDNRVLSFDLRRSPYYRLKWTERAASKR